MIELVFQGTTHKVCGHPKPVMPNFKSDRIVELEADICGLAPRHAAACGNCLTLRATPEMVAEMLERGI